MSLPDLQGYPVFADLAAGVAEVLQNRFELHTYASGDVIVRRGVHAGVFAVVSEGCVTRVTPSGTEEPLVAGDAFGADMLTADAASDVTYRAAQPATLQMLHRADWLAVLAQPGPGPARVRVLRRIAAAGVVLAVAALVIGPTLVTTLARDRAAAAMAAGQPAAAEGYLRLSLRWQPQAAAVHDALGSALYVQGETAAAVVQFRQAIELDAGLAAAQNNLGAALIEQHEPDRALEYLQQAVTLNPAGADAFANLGNAYLATGQRDAAAAAYQRAFELDPGQTDARAAWAAVMFGWGRYDQARQAWQTAIDARPDQPLALSGLGALAVREGNAAAALPRLEAAVAVDPAQASAFYYLGLAYTVLGQPEAATQAFERALSLSDDPDLVRPARAHLQALYKQVN